jgi:hypothetical protein
MADNLPLSIADVTEFGSLNLPQPSGAHMAVMGLLYLSHSNSGCGICGLLTGVCRPETGIGHEPRDKVFCLQANQL